MAWVGAPPMQTIAKHGSDCRRIDSNVSIRKVDEPKEGMQKVKARLTESAVFGSAHTEADCLLRISK